MNRGPIPQPCRLGCGGDVLVARKARPTGRSNFVVLDAKPLNNQRQHDGRTTRIVDGWFAYTIGHAKEHVQLASETFLRPQDATDIYDLPWHRLHDCPNRKDRN